MARDGSTVTRGRLDGEARMTRRRRARRGVRPKREEGGGGRPAAGSGGGAGGEGRLTAGAKGGRRQVAQGSLTACFVPRARSLEE